MKFQAEIIPTPQTDVVRYIHCLFPAVPLAKAKTQTDRWAQSVTCLRFFEVERFWYSFPEFLGAWCEEICQITESGPATSVGTLMMHIDALSAPLTYSKSTAS